MLHTQSKLRIWNWVKKRPWSVGLSLLLLIGWLFCLPQPLFDTELSTVLVDRNGELLGARIASDGQWRFPASDSLPSKYVSCVLLFEDRYFRWHPGINPVSMARALWQNLHSKKVVSGASTITMQVIRLARQQPRRTIGQKLLEMAMATRLELTHSKNTILNYYASNAPFGGNVVGLEAASWRYFGKKPASLTWAEAALLAVLPNSPALLHPGRGRERLLEKRNRLLTRLHQSGEIDATTLALSMMEPLPEKPIPLPQWAPHLSDRLQKSLKKGEQHRSVWSTTVDKFIQMRVMDILIRRQEAYRGNDIHNMAAVVLDVQSGDVLAYVGNVPQVGAEHGGDVDIIAAPRSTGSILKPYLYALSLESGDLLPASLLEDVPTQFGQYRPENYKESYDGAIAAKTALIRSLNVPFVHLLNRHGLEKFHFELQQLGLTTIRQPAHHYGLSLILGGAEANLLDITNVYACMARRLGAFYRRNGRVWSSDFRPPHFLGRQGMYKEEGEGVKKDRYLSPGAIWHTFEAMQEVERPNSAGEWTLFQSSKRIAWKTGTSFGFRDAWAVGVNARYAVGVWVGNADGEGRPGLIGVEMAAPVLFEVFQQLPGGDEWFDPPYDDMVALAVCKQSGDRSGVHCPSDTIWAPVGASQAPVCQYHRLIHLDETGQWQVNSDCADPSRMQHQSWFVLDPVQEHYYRSRHPDYIPLPPFHPDCGRALTEEESNPLRLIYPKARAQLYIPVDLDGQLSSVIFQATHRLPETLVYWHLDGEYIGSTRHFHQMSLQPAVGMHTLSLVDQNGQKLERTFEVMGK